MRLICLLLLATSLTGCGYVQRLWTHYTGELTTKCFRGVTYVQADSGLALLVDRDNEPVACGD